MKWRNFYLAILIVANAHQAAAKSGSNGGAPFRLCVLDQAMILQRSQLSTNMAARFQQIRQRAQADFENENRTLDADARALDSLRSSLPAAIASARSEDITRRRAQLKAKGDQINRNLADLDNQLTSNVAKAAEPAIGVAEKEHGCSLLVPRSMLIHLNDTSLDITADVLQAMNTSGGTPVPGR